MSLCDAVIRNDDMHPVVPQVLALHNRLLELSATSPASQKPRIGFPT